MRSPNGLVVVDGGDQFDPERWRNVPDALIPVRKVEPLGREGRRRQEKRDTQFVKGPLPLGWLAAVAQTGHPKAWAVLMALRYKADVTREAWVKPPPAALAMFGIDKDARSRALAALEQAGLVEVQRRKGRPPLVRVLPWVPKGDLADE